MKIPFNSPFQVGKELSYIDSALKSGSLSGNGPHTKWCQNWLVEKLHCSSALLTHSCTSALEMAAILCDLQPGDEVIMPSFTFVSTANAFVLRGATPVFVDIKPDTLNIDEKQISSAITPKTKAIVPVHYAGVSCEMEEILDIAKKHTLFVVEDAAQGIYSKYKGHPVGSLGDFGCLSFHETKNIISGEGGALLINRKEHISRAEIIWEKGTNRSQYFKGEVDKYTWVDMGSSFLPSEIEAAFLHAQLENADQIISSRQKSWSFYNEVLKKGVTAGNISLPFVPEHCEHNAHIFYVVFNNEKQRTRAIEACQKINAWPVFHYVPLHSSPAGKKFGRPHGDLTHTDRISQCLLRLPLWPGIAESSIQKICDAILKA